MKHTVLIALFLISFVSCKKDEPIDPGDSPVCFNYAEQIDADNCDFGVRYTKDFPWCEKPCFNPINSNEFVFRRGTTIWKHNISSGQSEIIKDNVQPYTQLEWGRSGWIAYTANDWDIWILREDGSELKRMTNAPRDWGPEFNYDGDRIMYGRGMEYTIADMDNNPELRERYKIVVISIDSIPVDSFCRQAGNDRCFPWEFCSWSSDNRIASELVDGGRYGLAIYDMDGNVSEVLYQSENTDENDDFIQDVEWHPDNSRVFFTDGFGLKVVDVTTKEVATIKESCDSKTYFDISISNNGKTILASREISTYSDCAITSRMDLVLMDIDGSNERVVKIE